MGRPEGTRDDDDPATLARRFLDLWQEEIAGTGRGEGPGALTLRLAALPLAALGGGGERGGLNANTDADTAAEARAEAAAAPSGDGAQRLAELSRRLAAFEERIVELAARGPGGDDGTPGGAGTGRS
ncbi:MAG: hypothetical protein OXI75_11545 [Rhodospirillales bacterium]|nr:hypothetical protein [Rhodospirillales bacterium]